MLSLKLRILNNGKYKMEIIIATKRETTMGNICDGFSEKFMRNREIKANADKMAIRIEFKNINRFLVLLSFKKIKAVKSGFILYR